MKRDELAETVGGSKVSAGTMVKMALAQIGMVVWMARRARKSGRRFAIVHQG